MLVAPLYLKKIYSDPPSVTTIGSKYLQENLHTCDMTEECLISMILPPLYYNMHSNQCKIKKD